MKLQIMKQTAVDILKNNLPQVYTNYSLHEDNKWIYEMYGEDPFIDFKDVTEFKLNIELKPNGELSAGKTDFKNIKIIYNNLKFLSESQAADERLWAGLCNSIFYDYMKQRWEYNKQLPKSADEIKGRYFFENKSGIFSNTLAMYWWTGHTLYDMTKANPFEKLDIIGASDIRTKIMLIFNYPFVRNPNITNGIVKCFKYFNDKDIKLNDIRHQVSPAMQKLNAIGGSIILDCLSEDEIADIIIKEIENTLDNLKKQKSSRTRNESEVDEDEIINENIIVGLGSTVKVKSINGNKEKIYKIIINERTRKLTAVGEELMNKKIGEIINLSDGQYKIVEIKN